VRVARQELGYPARATAYKWLKDAGIEPADANALMKKAREIKDWYGQEEKRLALQEILDRIHTILQEEEVDADALYKLAGSANRVVQSMQLIEGLETSRIVVEDKLDADLRELIQQEQNKNAERESEIESQFGS
jgi:hypothetical protein